MKRREFLATSAAAAAAITTTAAVSADDHGDKAKDNGGKFKLKYGPSPGQFKAHAGDDYLDQIQFAADQGFTGWEDNGLPRRDAKLQEAVGKKLKDNGMTMGVFVSVSAAMAPKSDKETRDALCKRMTEMLDVAKRCGAKWTTVVPGSVTQKIHMDYQTANVIDNLRALSEVCEPSGLVMVLEPLNWWANHPGLFLQGIPQSYMICRGVNSPSCKILDDLYHQQITEGNLIPNIDKAWDEIAYFQVGDNPGRKEPYSGEINYQNIFKHLHKKGYEGVIGMEHGHSVGGIEGEKKCIAAYRKADDFEV
ncbi:MAG: hydroxypyruvate isomerase family protein [Phycisphaeraceae bacterium]